MAAFKRGMQKYHRVVQPVRAFVTLLSRHIISGYIWSPLFFICCPPCVSIPEYRPSDPFSTDPSPSDPSFHRPQPFRLLLKLHILCNSYMFPAHLSVNLKEYKSALFTPTLLKEFITTLMTEMRVLMTQPRLAVKWDIKLRPWTSWRIVKWIIKLRPTV